MDVTTHDLPSPGDDLDIAWAGLVAQDPGASPFQGPAWVRTWAGRRADGPVRVRVVRHDGAAVAALPEVDLGEGRLTLPGGRDVTDYRGPVALPGDRVDVVDAWLASLAADGVVEVDLHGIATDTGWLDLLTDRAPAGGWSLDDREAEDVCPRVAIPDGEPEAWLEAVDAKERHELRRKARKLARDLGGMRVVEAEDLPAALGRFWELAMTSEGEKGEFFRDPEMRAFFDDVVATLGADGTVRIHELLVGDLPGASMVSVVDRAHGEWGLYNSALDEALAAFAPGTVLAAELCTAAATEGFTTFDFLRGDEAYKYRFGAVDRPIEQAVLRRST